jgi:hypothetical protein
MSSTRTTRWTFPLTLALVILAACAQQPAGTSGQSPGEMSGMNMQGHDMSRMSGMQGQDMSGMDMQTTMSRCATLHQHMRPDAAMTPDIQRVMAQCDQMDQQMGIMPGNPSMPPRTR